MRFCATSLRKLQPEHDCGSVIAAADSSVFCRFELLPADFLLIVCTNVCVRIDELASCLDCV